MLARLVDYARRRELTAEPGFAPKTVRWAISLAPDGRLLGVDELGAAGEKGNRGRRFSRCPELSQPEIKRGGPGCRHFLVDSADVVALLADGEPDAKLRAKHAYFTRLLREAAEAMPELAAAADCLGDAASLAEIRRQLAAAKAKPTDRMTFRFPALSPSFPVESEAWHGWWRGFLGRLARPASRHGAAPLARCLASGELVEPAATHPKIAGLADVGGLAMGDALVSFKQEAFRSYGLEQSANAPVSAAMAAAYRAALDDLIRETGRKLGGVKVVYWYERKVAAADDPLPWLFEPPAQQEASANRLARELLDAIHTGRRPDLAGNRYFVLTLSGAAGRVRVHDVQEGSFEELAASVDAWFGALEVVRRDGRGTAPAPALPVLLATLVRDMKDLPPAVGVGLLRSALHPKRELPYAAMAMALARAKTNILKNEPIPHPRAALLRAWWVRRGDTAMTVSLNEDHPDPAYQCGRLLALLAAVQYRALGDVGAGVIQRYYAAASATPALVLGRLTRTAQFHLDKLDRGLARWHEARIASVWSKIERVPTTLSLEKQSLFAMGYYHQVASDRARTTGAAAASTAPETQETDHDPAA
jgi:CRISPR-associated protein Csd1